MKPKARAHNEWNVPDWRDENLYPTPLAEKDDSDLLQWRWEFLRRDEEYRQDWLRIRAKDPEGKLAILDDAPAYSTISDIPLFVKEQYNNPYYFQKKYKLKKLLNPAQSKPRHLPFYPYPSETIRIGFDGNQPIRNELRRAKRILEKHQKSIKGAISRATIPEKKKWPLLLRAIDAQDQGLSLSDIGYQILGLRRERHDPNQAKAYAASRLEIGRRFWKKLRIPSP
jgi:hypothetical protein